MEKTAQTSQVCRISGIRKRSVQGPMTFYAFLAGMHWDGEKMPSHRPIRSSIGAVKLSMYRPFTCAYGEGNPALLRIPNALESCQ